MIDARLETVRFSRSFVTDIVPSSVDKGVHCFVLLTRDRLNFASAETTTDLVGMSGMRQPIRRVNMTIDYCRS